MYTELSTYLESAIPRGDLLYTCFKAASRQEMWPWKAEMLRRPYLVDLHCKVRCNAINGRKYTAVTESCATALAKNFSVLYERGDIGQRLQSNEIVLLSLIKLGADITIKRAKLRSYGEGALIWKNISTLMDIGARCKRQANRPNQNWGHVYWNLRTL